MNSNDFVLASDGWSQITPCGEFPHAGAGVKQVIDREACDRIAADFNGRKAGDNFPGVLADFDHFSLDTEKSSEAAGWISDLESRDTGLWARVRWSEVGRSSFVHSCVRALVGGGNTQRSTLKFGGGGTAGTGWEVDVVDGVDRGAARGRACTMDGGRED